MEVCCIIVLKTSYDVRRQCDDDGVELTNRLHLTVVCSVIDTQYDVICGKNKKCPRAA
jgi:hypothetical protein